MTRSPLIVVSALIGLCLNGHARAASISPDSGIHYFGFGAVGSSLGDLSFTLQNAAILTVADLYYSGDRFEITSGTASIGSSSQPVAGHYVNNNFSAALADNYFSRGLFLLQPGQYTLNGTVIANAPGYNEGTGALTLSTIQMPLSIGGKGFNFGVVGSQLYYIDPTLANGFDYKIGAGDPNFQSVLLPNDQPSYTISYTYNGTSYVQTATSESLFYFPTEGVSEFKVTGLTGFDSSDPPAFVTGLSFVSDGTFTGTQSPLDVISPVPLPASAPMFGAGLLGLAGLGYAAKRKKAAAAA